MFSGIIREIGTIERVEQTEEVCKVFVRAQMFFDESSEGESSADPVHSGDSVALNGVCLTHTAEEKGIGSFDVATETRRVTTLYALEVEDKVNLERSLRVGDRIDGHFVSGHVDGVSQVESIKTMSNTREVRFSLPLGLEDFFAPKGSVTVDGVSLTIGEVSERSFSVYIIPQTFLHTLFAEYEIGTKVNIEVDSLARYAVRAMRRLVDASVKETRK